MATYVWSGATGTGTGADWANALTQLPTDLNDNTYYIAHDHVQSVSVSSGYLNIVNTTPVNILCVNRNGSVPPTQSDLRRTARFNYTAPVSFTYCYIYGFDFQGQGTTGNQLLNFQQSSVDSCYITLPGNAGATSPIVQLASANMKNCSNTFSRTANYVNLKGSCRIEKSIFSQRTEVNPPFVLQMDAISGASVEIYGCDFDTFGSSTRVIGNMTSSYLIQNCFIHGCNFGSANPYLDNTTTLHNTNNYTIYNCGPSYDLKVYTGQGSVSNYTIAYRDGGAESSGVPVSWLVNSKIYASLAFSNAFYTPPMYVWVKAGAPVTVTVYYHSAADDNSEIFMDAYYQSVGVPYEVYATTNRGSPIDATTTYSLDASSTWMGSPAGSARKMELTFTPDKEGPVAVRVGIPTPSVTAFIDPKPVVS